MAIEQHKIARIKEFFIDEEEDVPKVTISWIWTERDLEAKLLNKYQTRSLPFELPDASKTIHKISHIYFDLTDEDTVSMETIDAKVLVTPTFGNFRDIIQTNWKSGDFAKIYYGKWCYDPQFGDYPFLKLDDALNFKPQSEKVSVLTLNNLRKHDDEYGHRQNTNSHIYRQQKQRQQNKIKRQFKTTKQHKINHHHHQERMDVDHNNRNNFENYRIPKRKSKFLPLIRTNSKSNDNKKRKRENLNDSKPNKKRKKDDLSSIPTDSSSYSDDNQSETVKKPKRSKTGRKKILEQNKTKISDEAMVEMKKICKRLNIGKPPNISCKLYQFESHLKTYKCIDDLFRNHNNESFRVFINKQKQSFCRDVKYALYTKGGIVPLATMKENISKRFNELKPRYLTAE